MTKEDLKEGSARGNKKDDFRKEDALNLAKWKYAVQTTAERMR